MTSSTRLYTCSPRLALAALTREPATEPARELEFAADVREVLNLATVERAEVAADRAVAPEAARPPRLAVVFGFAAAVRVVDFDEDFAVVVRVPAGLA